MLYDLLEYNLYARWYMIEWFPLRINTLFSNGITYYEYQANKKATILLFLHYPTHFLLHAYFKTIVCIGTTDTHRESKRYA